MAVAFSSALLLPSLAAPQTIELKPGDARLRGELLQPYTNQWKMRVIRSDGSMVQDAGTWTDQLEKTPIDGRPCWKRTQSATFKRKTGEIAASTRTVNVFDAKTLAPLYREFERHIVGGDDAKLEITFRGSSMKIEATAKGKSEVREVRTSEAFDFFGGVYALLWVALPLKRNFAATFPSYTEEGHPEIVQQVTYKVTARELAEAGTAGKVETWVVECDTAIGFLRYWISENAPYIIRMDYRDKSGATWTLSMT